MIGNLFHRSLLRRVSLALLLAFGAVYAVLLVYRGLEIKGQEQTGKWSRVKGLAVTTSLAALAEPATARAVAASMERMFNAEQHAGDAPGKVMVQVWDKRQREMVWTSSGAGAALWPGGTDSQARHVHAGTPYYVFAGETPRWSLRIAEPAFPDDWLWAELSKSLFLYLLIAFPVVLAPIGLAVSQGLRPLRRLTDQLGARGSGDLSAVRVDRPHKELVPLVSALNHLLARLREKVDREHAFVQDAAHELRTPMAVISAQAHVLSQVAGGRAGEDAAKQMAQAVSRGSHVIEQMLQLATVDQDKMRVPRKVDLAQLAQQVLAQRAPAAMARGMELALDAPESLWRWTDLEAMQSVLHNLVDNAILYGRANGRVAVALAQEGESVRLSVADDGPGIPVQDWHLVFERFHRGADHDASGSGLGLAIVKQAVARLGGEVALGVGLGGQGCCFTVTLASADR